MLLLCIGESGLVYKASLNTMEGKEIVAVKTVKGINNILYQICMSYFVEIIMSAALFATPDVNKLIKEITTMLSFDHPNVMTLIGVSLDRESPLLIMPFMSKGSVLEYVKHHKEELLHTSEAETAQVVIKVSHSIILTLQAYDTFFPTDHSRKENHA